MGKGLTKAKKSKLVDMVKAGQSVADMYRAIGDSDRDKMLLMQ